LTLGTQFERKIRMANIPNKGRKMSVPKWREQMCSDTHNFTEMFTCPHCARSGKGPKFKRFHFDECKKKGV
jgi:hypothetical protein